MKMVNMLTLMLIVVYLATPAASQHGFVLDGTTLGEILKALKLGTSLSEWPNRMQPEGLGGIIAVFHRLRILYPATTNSLVDIVENHKIVSFGGLGGNFLDCLITSLIGAAMGMQCDLWVIQDEYSPGTYVPAAKEVIKQILTLIEENPNNFKNINILHLQSFDIILEEEIDEVKELKAVIINTLTTPANRFKAIKILLNKKKEYVRKQKDGTTTSYNPYNEFDISEYSLALDGITGTSQDSAEFKVGAVWVLGFLKDFENLSGLNCLMSMDYPSFWKGGKMDMIDAYILFEYGALNPGAIIHQMSKKPFALGPDCKNKASYVVSSRVVENFLKTKSVEDIRREFVNSTNKNPFVKKSVAFVNDDKTEVLQDPKDIDIAVEINDATLSLVHVNMSENITNTYTEYIDYVKTRLEGFGITCT